MSYDLLKIGKEYTREILSDKGRTIGYECNLVVPDSSENFALTQVIRMLPAGHEKAQELVDAKLITPDMSSTAIGKVIKGLNEPEETSAASEPSEEPKEVTHEEWLRMTFDKISTEELVEELKKRGFSVLNREGGEM